MKRLKLILLATIISFIGIINVYAKDTVYSVSKYEDEKLTIIKDSYNKENKKDGIVTTGIFLKEKDEENKDYQVMLIKYKKSGKVAWTYRYGRTSSEDINELLYTYDNNKINGYLMVISNSYDILSSNTPKSLFVTVDLDGKFQEEKETGLNTEEIIKKLIPTYSIDDIVDGYIGITDTSIIKYDKDLNLVYRKDIQNKKYIDIVDYTNENDTNYALITEELVDNKPKYNLITYNNSLIEEKLIKENIEINNIKLSTSDNGYIVYGITNDVKLKKSDTSYYLSKYNNLGEEVWESIGNIPLDKDSDIVLKTINNNYIVLYKNVDKSYEVIKLDEEGLLQNKIKKINNGYYDFINYSISLKEKTLYFVGRMKCPEDEKCDYENNSLFLISTEDKVIEVEDTTSANILVGILVIIILIGVCIYLVKSKGIKNKKK